jgi:transcriptional regulator with XRE-family HTH domain
MYLERINLLCALKGISQSKLAFDLGISKQALNNYIKGKNAFNDVVKLGILRYFDLPEKIFTQHEINFVLKGNHLTVL